MQSQIRLNKIALKLILFNLQVNLLKIVVLFSILKNYRIIKNDVLILGKEKKRKKIKYLYINYF